MKKKQGLPDSANTTIDRRDWMRFFGKAAALSLSGGVLSRCSAFGDDPVDFDSETGRTTDTSLDTETGIDAGNEDTNLCLAGDGFPYQPETLKADLEDVWPAKTVDEQDLESILATWRLTIDGMVANPMTLSFAEMIALPRRDETVDFHCVEGWSVLDIPWNGIHIKTLADKVIPDKNATHITFHTINSAYNESLPIEVALEPKTLLAYGVDCRTIPLSHGFPLRLVVPRLLAYKSAKYVTRLEFTDEPVFGYWVAVGYPYDGEVPESRLRDGKY
jgi:hypothetical protein